MSFDIVIPAKADPVARHFNLREFACKGCNTVRINPRFLRVVDFLEALRSRTGGRPVIITSGYRCSEYNKTVAGASTDSRHMYGDGVDFTVSGFSPAKLADELESLGFPGVIIEYSGHLHTDLRPTVPNPRRWRA